MIKEMSVSALVAVTAIVLAVVGSMTFLTAQGDLSGGTASSLLVLILGATGVVSSVHVTGQVVKATNGHDKTSVPAGPAPGPLPAPAPVPPTPGKATVA